MCVIDVFVYEYIHDLLRKFLFEKNLVFFAQFLSFFFLLIPAPKLFHVYHGKII